MNALIVRCFEGETLTIGSTATFGSFALIDIGSMVFVRRFVPETDQCTLESLEAEFRGLDTAAVTTVPR